MIPGIQSRGEEEVVASAATIVVKRDLVRVTGTTQIDTILSPQILDRGTVMIFLYTPDAGVTVSAAGNVAVSQALTTNRLYAYLWSSIAAKWIPHAIN